MTRVSGALLLGFALLIGCSPAPTPRPSTSATVEAAAQAYSAFVRSWSDEHAADLNAKSSAADADQSLVGEYATTLADAYQAFGDGVRAIDFPGSVRPEVDRELDTIDVLVGLANRLADSPSDMAVKTELQRALARAAESSASVEAVLGVSR